MYSLYDQLQKERTDRYDNGLYYIYKYNIFSTINNLFNINLSSFQTNTFIQDDIIPTDITPLLKKATSKIPRKLILISNRYTPNWILDHLNDELTLENLCNMHKQITFLPLREIYRISTWSGKILSQHRELILLQALSAHYANIMDWYENVVPVCRKQRLFKHGNTLFAYILFVQECLRQELFPPILNSNCLNLELNNDLLSDVELAIVNTNSEILNLRY